MAVMAHVPAELLLLPQTPQPGDAPHPERRRHVRKADDAASPRGLRIADWGVHDGHQGEDRADLERCLGMGHVMDHSAAKTW